VRLLLLLALLGCRRKPPVEEVVEPKRAPVAVESKSAPVAVELPVSVEPLEVRSGHPPSDDDLRARLGPLLPDLAGCVALLHPETPVVLRFAVSPETGKALAVELAGHADGCAAQALEPLRFERWSGLPSLVEVPLSREGKTMVATDGGFK
jgi:hypothetical protein